MSAVSLVLFVILILAGIRAAWAGIRGLRGEIGVRYGWPLNSLMNRLSSEERSRTDQLVLKLGSAARLLFGLALIAIGAYSLWIGLVK